MPNPSRVFIDANILIRAGKPPGGALVRSLVDLVVAKLISVTTTDLTKVEVVKFFAKKDFEKLNTITTNNFRHLAKQFAKIEIPDLSREEILEAIWLDYTTKVDVMFSALEAEEVSIDDVKPNAVLEQYSRDIGFFAGEGKRDQFPDAFIFERIKMLANKDSQLVIVSDDKDYKAPCRYEEFIELVPSVPLLFEHLGIAAHKSPEKIVKFMAGVSAELITAFDMELAEWTIHATDVEEAYIHETEVTDVVIERSSVYDQIGESDTLLVLGVASLTVDIGYEHPDWDSAIYDSEEKQLMAFDKVSGEAETEVKVSFALSILIDDDGDPVEIESANFTHESTLFVELHPKDEYDYR